MTDRSMDAQRALVAVVSHLALGFFDPADEAVWMGVLAKVLKECPSDMGALAQVHGAAVDVVSPRDVAAHRAARDRLAFEVRTYWARAAAARVSALGVG